MALEVEQGLKINESDHRRAELGQESEASSATLALGQNSQAPQDTVLELQGDTQALQESNSKYEELMKENWQLQGQVAELGIQLQNEKATNHRLSSLKEKLFKLVEMQMLPRSLQGAEEKQLEELGEQKQLTEVQEALLREQETNALVTQENERLLQEVVRLTSWTEQLQAEQEDLLTKNQELQASIKKEQQSIQSFHNLYHKMMLEQRSKEINLPKLSAQCQSLTLLTKELEEERRQVRSQTNTLKQLSKTLLEEHAGTWHQNKGSLMTEPTGNAEEEDEDSMTQTKDAQSPASGMRKSRSRLRALLRFFQRQRHGSRVQAKSPAESAPGSPEATSAVSGWLEDRDTGSGPLPKATGQQKSAFWSRKKKDKVKDQPPRASSTLSNLICCCKR